MEARVRIRVGTMEVEIVGEQEFVINRLPNLASDLMSRLTVNYTPVAPGLSPAGANSSDAKFVNIEGSVRDYWTDALVPGAMVTTIDPAPNLLSLSDEMGRFILSGRTLGERYSLLVNKPASYIETINRVEMLTESTMHSAMVVSIGDMRRQYVSLGLTPSPDTAIVIIDLLEGNGAPLELVPATDIHLMTASGTPVGSGPYFFGASGDLVPLATMSESRAFANRARAAFIDVPSGEYILRVTVTRADNIPAETVVAVPATGGATLIQAMLTN